LTYKKKQTLTDDPAQSLAEKKVTILSELMTRIPSASSVMILLGYHNEMGMGDERIDMIGGGSERDLMLMAARLLQSASSSMSERLIRDKLDAPDVANLSRDLNEMSEAIDCVLNINYETIQ